MGLYWMINDPNPSLFEYESLQDLPLAALLRPSKLDEVIGQSHLLSPGKPIEQIVTSGKAISIVLWGPPGTGKTTLAEIIAAASDCPMIRISAVTGA